MASYSVVQLGIAQQTTVVQLATSLEHTALHKRSYSAVSSLALQKGLPKSTTES